MEKCLLCAKCCEETEMLLANADIDRIRKHTHLSRRYFAYYLDGYLYLKNNNKYCIFLVPETKRCSIYEVRPIGCRFYPIIYNPFVKKCVVDKDCTNRENMRDALNEINCNELEKFILLLNKERAHRLRRNKRKKVRR
jgi:Fe-S-cluster containining protein